MTAKKGSGDRSMGVRVKTSRGRTVSQQRWLLRQLNDPYVVRAKKDGYKSRAAYKLLEIDEKYHILKPGQRIIDLGCAPGGWSQIAARVTGSAAGRGIVIGIDLLPVEPISGVTLFEGDFMADEVPGMLKTALGGKADIVMSDMAGNTTGLKQTDHLRIIGLAEASLDFAREILVPGGVFLSKLFQGGETAELVALLKRDFKTVRHVKPAASRADSSELYVLATGYRGTPTVIE
jgi:23S rRNA (uridine2552-2'-O)-methyltransferase